MERTYDLVFMFASKKIEGRVSTHRAPRSPRPLQPPGQPRGGLRRLVRPARACSPFLWGNIGYFSMFVFGACCRARREVFACDDIRVRNTIRAHPGLLIIILTRCSYGLGI